MEAHLTAYARGPVINKAKQVVKNLDEYRTALQRLEEAERNYKNGVREFERQAQELKARTRNPLEFQRKLGELQRRAAEALKPQKQELSEGQANLKRVELQQLAQLLHPLVEDEVGKVYILLEGSGLKDIQHSELTPRGRLGIATVLSLHFNTDKDSLKEIKRKLEKISFQKIEIFIDISQ